MRPKQTDFHEIMKVAKRIAITVLITIPFLIAFSYYTRNIITSNALTIFIYVTVMAIVVFVEELIARKKHNNDDEIEPKHDVFK